MSKDILVYIEQRQGQIQSVAYELLGEARRLSEKNQGNVVGLLMGYQTDSLVEELKKHDLDEVIVADDKALENYKTLEYTKVFSDLLKEREFDIVLVGATSIGRDLAPRVSARIHTGLTADCTKLEYDTEKEQLLMTRPAFGGNLLATIICPDFRPQMATVRPGVMLEGEGSNPNVKVTPYEGKDIEDPRVKVIDYVDNKEEIIDLTKARVILAGGRGIGSREDFENLHELTDLIDGEVAGSRAAVDAGWIPQGQQVGQTGVTVRPILYIACGISGAIQHIAGMEQSETIIAINRDPDAPIFNYSDLGIVGDYKEILPLIIKGIKEKQA